MITQRALPRTKDNVDLHPVRLVWAIGLVVALITATMWASPAQAGVVTDLRALQTALNGGRGVLGADIDDTTRPLILGPNTTAVLDLNGHTLRGRGVWLDKGVELTVMDSSSGQSGLLLENLIPLSGWPSFKLAGARLIVAGGKVFAAGGSGMPGIGGGCRKAGDTACGEVIITGGQVIASGGRSSAGIGGGPGEASPLVRITGGSVSATGGECAAGIGGGDAGSRLGGTIQITGGQVVARGGARAAGIGAGCGASQHQNGEPAVKISGGVLTATGGANAAGIGGGDKGDGLDVTISGGRVEVGGPNAIGAGLLGSGNRFGSLVVGLPGRSLGEATLTLNSQLVLTDRTATEVTVESSGLITGPGSVAGVGRVSNAGAITNDVAPTVAVSRNSHLVSFVGADNPPVQVYADSFEIGRRPLPAAPPGTAWYTRRTASRAFTSPSSISAAGIPQSQPFTLYALTRPAAPVVTVTQDASGPVLSWTPVYVEGMSKYSFLLCPVAQVRSCGPDVIDPPWLFVPGVDPVLRLGNRLPVGVSYQVWVRVMALNFQGGGDLAGEPSEPVTVTADSYTDLPGAAGSPALAGGDAEATVDGAAVKVKVKQHPRTGTLRSSATGWRVSVAGQSHGKSVLLAAGAPQVIAGENVRISARGFAPTSEIQVWLSDTPLGSLTSNAHGRVTGELRIPAGRQGDQTLEVSGPLAGTNAALAVKFGIQVHDDYAVATSTRSGMKVRVLARCSAQYRFTIQKSSIRKDSDGSGNWRKVGKVHRTVGSSQTRTVKLPPGTYRAAMKPHCGQPGTTTNTVIIDR